MAFFRQYIAPLLIFLVFFIALVAVTARTFLPGDMAAPAPIEEAGNQQSAISHQESGLLSDALRLDPQLLAFGNYDGDFR